MASATTRLSKPWQVDWTITQCRMPSMACNANSFSLGASAGVNGRFSAKGKIFCGPNTWTCASHAPAGSSSFGRLGEARKDGRGSAILLELVFLEADRPDDRAPPRLLLGEESGVLRRGRRESDSAHLGDRKST